MVRVELQVCQVNLKTSGGMQIPKALPNRKPDPIFIQLT